jgi:glycosyltransferase involved in cell wall biosynthesis
VTVAEAPAADRSAAGVPETAASDAAGSAARRPLRVLFLPDYGRGNPYQRELARELGSHGITVIGAKAPKRDPLGVLSSWWHARRPHVVHLHWTHPYLGQRATGRHARWRTARAALFVAQLMMLRLLRVRIIWTLHNLGIHEERADERLNVAIHRQLVRNAGAVIAHCEAAVRAAVDTYHLGDRDARKLRVIPHGNYVDVYGALVERAVARAQLNVPEDVRLFVFIGGARAYKGITELIEAIRALPSDTNARLIVAGRAFDQAEADTIREAAGDDDRITLRLEFIPDEDLPVLLGAADAVALPFRDILTSGSAILAMSYGRPVIAPSLGCLPETLPADGNLLYDPDDAGGLRWALWRALTADLDSLGAQNLEGAKALDWAGIAESTARVYRGE